jgi:hypothetical protein
MSGQRIWIILGWIALPTVMYGGYSLMQLMNRGNVLTPVQVTSFRAGHVHAGVLTLMSILYYTYLDQTALPVLAKNAACVALLIGILAQSGGFFIQLHPGRTSLVIGVTITGAAVLACAILVLIVGLVSFP